MFEYTINELKGLWKALLDMRNITTIESRKDIDNHIMELKQVIAILSSAPMRIKQAYEEKQNEIHEIINEETSRTYTSSKKGTIE